MKKTQKLDWSAVNDNSSSVDAVVSLARGEYSFRECQGMVWCPDVKRLFRGLSRLTVRTARNKARAWCRREGFDYSRF